ncbi:3-dehydroquinate synthase [Peribacillus sp. SCS-26]|uniref:3-dehydroquinate synthase n=1 Tax=Paraperibacillus marinus TaxID=3115295 RepID=UPI0039059396
MEIIQIETETKSYPVYLGEGMIRELPAILAERTPSCSSLLVISSETVAEFYLNEVCTVLSKTGIPIHDMIVPDGESAKTFEIYYACLTRALELNLDRHAVILALGGGAAGDLAGFVAATYMRGIPFIQLPTTILAHDSSVGGKVAINHEAGKNMIGAFHQPEAVIYDLAFLKTLPEAEVRSGFAEIIKEALIADPEFYGWIRGNVHTLSDLGTARTAYAIKKGIQIKGHIVQQDEKETGIRAFLNFGHTLGHAIENNMGYGAITHGEGVMIGMIFALKLSTAYLGLSFDREEFEQWAASLGFQTSIPADLDPDALLRAMKKDKKTAGGQIRFVLLKELGKPELLTLKDKEILTHLLD